MPVTSSTSVAHANPANVSVTIQESSGGGGYPVYVDVHFIVAPRFATIAAGGHAPAGYTVSPTTISWLNKTIPAGGGETFSAMLDQPNGSELLCSTVTIIVNGTYAGAEYYASFTPTVCFA